MTERDVETGSFLTGVRVVEIADELGEYCGKILAGLGADVIKVEPLGGERTRGIGPFVDDRPDPNRSLHFWHYNFGKRAIVLDLETPEGREQFSRLVRTADVLLDTRHRDYLRDRGLGYEELRRTHLGLVYARISPFGDAGPWADHLGSDLIHLALGGVVMNCGYDPDPTGTYDTPPVAPQMWHSYHITGRSWPRRSWWRSATGWRPAWGRSCRRPCTRPSRRTPRPICRTGSTAGRRTSV
ncbi:hypothetical protein SVIO_103190 [Streptomyces violaceusniger]|uniref:CoA transferase n=1 Tax=Streptomyces violaceusniger TaxID=68280 RepID=A0A4D4LK80_STRVO|nr:hypothetical protein SVIO_103190 [Streptomyces violaceusniger]